MRIMAIDYGAAHTGVAVSDLTGTIPGDAWVIDERDRDCLAEKIAEEARLRQVSEIVLGLPTHADGSIGESARASMALGETLKELTGISPKYQNEQNTTVIAWQILNENNSRGRKRKKRVDAVAATQILERYLSLPVDKR